MKGREVTYRVSMKSFPDYEHLQCYKKTTWDTNIFFLPLLKLFSKILCHVFIVTLQLQCQNGVNEGESPVCFVVSRNKITGHSAAEIQKLARTTSARC